MNLKQYLRGTGGTHKKYISEVKLDAMGKFDITYRPVNKANICLSEQERDILS